MEVEDGDAIRLVEPKLVEAAHARPLMAKHLAFAREGIGVDVMLPGESGFHEESMPNPRIRRSKQPLGATVRPMIARRACVATAVAAALAATSLAGSIVMSIPAHALPMAPVPGTDLHVVSSLHYIVPDQGVADAALRSYDCYPSAPLPGRPGPLDAALARADAVVAAKESPQARRAFATSRIYRSAPQLESAFALSVMNNRPGGALAASLRLARLKNDPRHLINAAVLLVGLDAADVAYDLLSAARSRTLGTMAGVDGEAAWQSAMGSVLLEYGQYEKAKEAYEAALARDPLMSTARQGMARALKCLGDEEQASLWQGRSQTLLDPGADFVVTPGDEDGNPPTWTSPGMPGVLDLAQGKKAPAFRTFVPPPIPNIPKGGYSIPVAEEMWPLYEKALLGVPQPPLTHTQDAFMTYVSNVLATDPALVRLAQESEDLGEELKEINPDSTCMTIDSFEAYWSWIGRNYDVARLSAERSYLIYTAAAASTGDPEFNKYLNDLAAWSVEAAYAGFLYGLMAYADAAETQAQYVRDDDANPDFDDPNCNSSFGAAPPSTKYTSAGPNGKGERSSPCKGMGPLAKKDILTIDVPIPGSPVKPKVKINCERVSLSAKFASIGGPYADMGLFASADYEWQSQDIVLFAGAFAELGPLGAKAGPSMRFGPDANGDFTFKDFSFTTKIPGIRSGERARRPASTVWLIVT